MPRRGIQYITSDIPPVQPPPYHGERYEDTVPDTLDIAERAALGVNAVTAPMDLEADCEQYFGVELRRNPPVMSHSSSDWCGTKFWEALPLLRIASGSSQNEHVDPVWRQVILKSIGPDGLYYVPVIGRPWQRPRCEWADRVYLLDGRSVSVDAEEVTQTAHTQPASRLLGTMTLYYLRDRNPLWIDICKRMVGRLNELAIDKDDYCYFPVAAYAPCAKADPNAEMPVGIVGEEVNGRLPQGLAQFYRSSDYEPALKLAGKLTNYMRYHCQYYDEEGRFISREDWTPAYGLPSAAGPHFHASTIALLGMLEYGMVASDHELLKWIGKSYEWAKTCETSWNLVGFFPELMNPQYPTSESCEVADMIALALKLSEAGIGDYWDDADRWIRNQFVESQLTHIEWVEKVAAALPHQPIPDYATADQVAKRNIGGFAGAPTASDFGGGLAGCCTGNGVRTIYYIWQHAVRFQEGQLKVNLLLNRASAWADVYSHIPYQGRVDIKIKQPCKTASVRMPEWVPSNDLRVVCEVKNNKRKPIWEGRYLNLGAVQPGDDISVIFPIQERTIRETIGGLSYTLMMKGNSVVSIDPPGQYCPLYQREPYRNNETRWRKVQRFVSAEQIEW